LVAVARGEFSEVEAGALGDVFGVAGGVGAAGVWDEEAAGRMPAPRWCSSGEEVGDDLGGLDAGELVVEALGLEGELVVVDAK